MRFVTAALVLALLAVAGCDILGPVELTGTWRLKDAEGEPLPVVLDVSDNFQVRYRQELVGGSLALRDDGTYTMSRSHRTTTYYKHDDVTQVTEDESVHQGPYTTRGDTLRLEIPGGTPDHHQASIKGRRILVTWAGTALDLGFRK